MNPKYLRQGFAFALAHAVEEAGEFLAAAGKTLRWGRESVNPELPVAEQETNGAWVGRELTDLHGALGRLVVEMVESNSPIPPGYNTPWSTDVTRIASDRIRIGIMLSTDPGPARAFHPFLDVDLNEVDAAWLLHKLTLAIRQNQASRDGGA